MHLPNAQNIQSMYAHNEGPHHKPIDEWLILNFNLPRMLTNPPSTICPRSQGMHTLLVSTVTHTNTDIWSIRPWSAAVDSDWPTNPTRFSEIGNTRLHSLTHRPSPPLHPRASQRMICAPSLYARGLGSEPIRGVCGTILRILNGAGDQVIFLFWQIMEN